MSRLLAQPEFADWLAAFLPGIADGEPASLFTPAVVSDASDGQIAHLHGLNASRAYCWRRIAESLPDGDARIAPALAAARHAPGRRAAARHRRRLHGGTLAGRLRRAGPELTCRQSGSASRPDDAATPDVVLTLQACTRSEHPGHPPGRSPPISVRGPGFACRPAGRGARRPCGRRWAGRGLGADRHGSGPLGRPEVRRAGPPPVAPSPTPAATQPAGAPAGRHHRQLPGRRRASSCLSTGRAPISGRGPCRRWCGTRSSPPAAAATSRRLPVACSRWWCSRRGSPNARPATPRCCAPGPARGTWSRRSTSRAPTATSPTPTKATW